MAALAHGRPVLGLRGPNTDAVLAGAGDALALTPLGDRAAFAARGVELTSDLPRLRAIGDAGRQLYESEFDWPVLTQNAVRAIDQLTCYRPSALAAA
jgi:glycosyltransferase involved in cell wall biosynthesis